MMGHPNDRHACHGRAMCTGSRARCAASPAAKRTLHEHKRFACRYYRDAKQEPPKLDAEEAAVEPVDERKPLDPEQLLREAEEVAGNLDEVRATLPHA